MTIYGLCSLVTVIGIEETDPYYHRPYFSALLRLTLFGFGAIRVPTIFAAIPLAVVNFIALATFYVLQFPMTTLTADTLFSIAFFFFALLFARHKYESCYLDIHNLVVENILFVKHT